LLATHAPHLLAISFGAVFFGAATYIGNGPNFMVKAVAERCGVRMPSFLEFILKFTLPFLLPVLVTVWLLFFRD
jgi:Na+/H+ antiporter NhaD/arsenite permease-like protein